MATTYIFAGHLFLHLWESNFIQAGMDDLLARSRVIKSDALPFGGEDDEHKAGQERHAHWQILEQLLCVPASIREEAVLQPHIAERHCEENHRREEGMHKVQRLKAEPPELVGIIPLLLFLLAGEVEHIEAVRCGKAII